MKKVNRPKLSLCKETLRKLDPPELQIVVAGDPPEPPIDPTGAATEQPTCYGGACIRPGNPNCSHAV